MPVIGVLLIGDGPVRGAMWGAVHQNHANVPLESLYLVGPGMHRLPLIQPHGTPLRQDVSPAQASLVHALALPPGTVWSRTIGALGGHAVWQRLVGLRVAVIGVGRTGSVMAELLTRLGVSNLTLIDPDRIEAHNLGEMTGVRLDAREIGRPKVAAVAEALSIGGQTTSTALPLPVTADTTRQACTQADVLVSCVDNDAARLATAIYAALYHKVLLDIGTGIAFQTDLADRQQPRPRTMGADVRLIVPGNGCLLCCGNLANFPQAVEDLGRPQPPRGQPEWHQQRAGSLRTLNQLAAAIGLQMLQDLVAERIQASTWAHLTFDVTGRLAVQYPTLPSTREATTCALCARAGLGDTGLRW